MFQIVFDRSSICAYLIFFYYYYIKKLELFLTQISRFDPQCVLIVS